MCSPFFRPSFHTSTHNSNFPSNASKPTMAVSSSTPLSSIFLTHTVSFFAPLLPTHPNKMARPNAPFAPQMMSFVASYKPPCPLPIGPRPSLPPHTSSTAGPRNPSAFSHLLRSCLAPRPTCPTSVFLFVCAILTSATTPHKLAPRSTACVFLGYPSSQKGYRCLNRTTNRVITSRHVVFDETIYPFSTDSLAVPPSALDFLSDDFELALAPPPVCATRGPAVPVASATRGPDSVATRGPDALSPDARATRGPGGILGTASSSPSRWQPASPEPASSGPSVTPSRACSLAPSLGCGSSPTLSPHAAHPAARLVPGPHPAARPAPGPHQMTTRTKAGIVKLIDWLNLSASS